MVWAGVLFDVLTTPGVLLVFAGAWPMLGGGGCCGCAVWDICLSGWVRHDDGFGGGHALLVSWQCEECIDGIWVRVLVCHGDEGSAFLSVLFFLT